MGLFDKKNNESNTEKIMQERNSIKFELATKLYSSGFGDDEVEIVLSIIETAENDIKLIKDGLIGTNINTKGDPMAPLSDAKDAIRKRQLEMQQEIQEAINGFIQKRNK